MDLESRVRSELRPGERILWIGQPLPGRSMLMSIPLVIFAIPWTCFALFWTAGASGLLDGMLGINGPVQEMTPFRLLFSCFGLPFIAIGLGMLSAPYWARRKSSQTVYAVTDQRALTLEAGLFGGTTLRNFPPEDLRRMTRHERADGSGNLIFEEYMTRNSDGHRHTTQRGFLAIARVREVEETIRQALLQEP